jgi:hypothetical protein
LRQQCGRHSRPLRLCGSPQARRSLTGMGRCGCRMRLTSHQEVTEVRTNAFGCMRVSLSPRSATKRALNLAPELTLNEFCLASPIRHKGSKHLLFVTTHVPSITRACHCLFTDARLFVHMRSFFNCRHSCCSLAHTYVFSGFLHYICECSGTIRVAEYLTFTPLMSDATLEPLRSVFDVERQSDRIEYTVRVSDQGSYQVNIYLLESWHSQAGDRTFTVSLQGVPVLSSIDLVQQVGFQVRPPRMQSSCPPLP